MSLATCLRALPLLVGAPLSLLGPGTELTFVPEEGLTVGIRIEQTTRSAIVSESWVVLYDGDPVEGEEGSSDGGSGRSFDLGITFVDVYDAVEGDRVTALTRTFEDAEGDTSMTVETDEGEELMEAGLTTPLVGRTVEFEWDEDEEEYDVSFGEDGEDEEVDAILLEGMRIDAFGAWFLPEAGTELEEGDEWDAGADAWFALLDIGGDFWIDVEGADPPSESAAESNRSQESQMRENAEGEAICTFEGLREVDGVELAVVSIALELATSSEVESDGGYEDEDVTVVNEVELTVIAEGTCLWNAAAGRLHSIRLEVELEDTTVSTDTFDEDGETYGTQWTWETESTTTIEYRFEER